MSGKATHERHPREVFLLDLSSNCEWAWQTSDTLLYPAGALVVAHPAARFSLASERALVIAQMDVMLGNERLHWTARAPPWSLQHLCTLILVGLSFW